MKLLLGALIALLPVVAIKADEPVDFVRDVRPVLERACYSCHAAEKRRSGLRLDVKASAFDGGEAYGESIIPGESAESPLFQLISSSLADERMPPDADPLSPEEIELIGRWIDEGAIWPEGVDTAALEDPRDHWSFRPLAQIGETASIDSFIQAKLAEHDLRLSSETDRVSWLRRASFDLLGLPPTKEQVEAFVGDSRGDAYERALDELLESPRYGERWAQHWLDVVRYADTHGFEVNTERPHAWPYRDYVIQAFNDDRPYDQFVREQISGDACGADSATGFLVTASVLLPGQIGQDAPSMRLARQDALDEIVNNVGQTFLGLSIGCARCHDHMFDPISQREYFAMQAFVAGVEYGDRTVDTPESAVRRQDEQLLRQRRNEIDEELSRLEPLARVGVEAGRMTEPGFNEEIFTPLEASIVRFTIHDANRHPSLGLIEPCLDEVEILTDESTPRNIALADFGTRVTASGSRTSDIHRLEFVNDGQYGNSRSWMSDSAGTGWVQFEFPQPVRIGSMRWSRDREGMFSDRLATAFTIEAGETADSLRTLVAVTPARPMVNPKRNSDRFTPTRTKKLRFTVLATESLEPCLDELEVFDLHGTNVALSTNGTVASSSGDNFAADRHELRFVNDGHYGNSRSWMSGEVGAGWVILEFDEEQIVDRVVWGRDREGMFADRLAIEYRIEVADNDGVWREVAGSADRVPFSSDDVTNESDGSSFAGLPPEEKSKAIGLSAERDQIDDRIAEAVAGQLAFAGIFREPDMIRLLHRGDPEQPKEVIAPRVMAVLGRLELPVDTPEQQRRIALADWITDPENPLTARVMVNRIWQGHFGIGLVDTASDFGRSGTAPTHPQLLDWLAQEFIRSGWSIKQMHRLIMLSATYRQSTRFDAGAAAIDADCRLLWRFPPRRIDAEVIRDSMLLVSGELNLQMGGRGYDLFDQRGGLSGFRPIESFGTEGLRRMIYAHKVRREREAVFGAFDCPDAGQSTSRRRESTTPVQALNLFNSTFTIERSAAFANRVVGEVGDDPADQIRRAYRLAFDRDPSADELEEAEPIVKDHGLETLCRAIFNSNEFLFLP